MPPSGPLAGHRICLDPGHDARWAPGAAGSTRSGVLATHRTERIAFNEHELTLAVAERLQALLEEAGASVCLTRHTRAEGGSVLREPYDFNGDDLVRPSGIAVEDTPEIVQPRIDVANDFGAEILLSIHFNGSSDASIRGSEAYYSAGTANGALGKHLAESVLTRLVEEMNAAGYNAARSRGVMSDAYQRYSAADTQRLFAAFRAQIVAHGQDPARCPDCYRLFTLGNNPISLHPGSYVGVLIEVEFLSNPAVVEDFLLRPDSLDVIARGIMRGVLTYYTTP
jgi:N-acetylmuramoyl-L-alanine amidase